jgi:hypothetical protein
MAEQQEVVGWRAIVYAPGVNTCTRLVALAGVALLAGCTKQQNDRILVGRGTMLEAFAQAPGAAAETGEPALREQVPTLRGLDRGNWEPTLVLMPVDGTAHGPLYAKQWRLANQTARQRQEFPTALSALEQAGGSETQQQMEALVNPLLAASDVVLLPVRVILQAPWATRWSPDVGYTRAWDAGAPGGAVPTAEPPPAAAAP